MVKYKPGSNRKLAVTIRFNPNPNPDDIEINLVDRRQATGFP